MDLSINGEEIVRSYYEKELQKTNQKKFTIKKVNKRKGDKLYVKWKGYNNLSSYATKTDLKNISRNGITNFTLKSNFASIKTEVDKLDADKLKIVSVVLAKLSNIVKNVKNDFVKKTEYKKLVTKVHTKYEKHGKKLEKKISDVDKNVAWLKNIDFSFKMTEVEGKIPSITGSVTSSALTAVEKEISNFTNLIEKNSETEDKINNHNHDKCITIQEFNRLTTEYFKARLNQANLISKTDIDTELKKN